MVTSASTTAVDQKSSEKGSDLTVDLPSDLDDFKQKRSRSFAERILRQLLLKVQLDDHMEHASNKYMLTIDSAQAGMRAQSLGEGFFIVPGNELLAPRLPNATEQGMVTQAVEAQRGWSARWLDQQHVVIWFTAPGAS